jgi:hypothetical protein
MRPPMGKFYAHEMACVSVRTIGFDQTKGRECGNAVIISHALMIDDGLHTFEAGTTLFVS